VTGTELLAFLKTVPANVLDKEVRIDDDITYPSGDEDWIVSPYLNGASVGIYSGDQVILLDVRG
jgi:hypothetical protein